MDIISISKYNIAIYTRKYPSAAYLDKDYIDNVRYNLERIVILKVKNTADLPGCRVSIGFQLNK